ncbi:MAG: AraC family transcriptional regulator [Saprospiraceae bacterium]|nr:AraC family transcriptional regulator [Lewinella sp.]
MDLRIRKALNFIEREYGKKILLKDLAQQAGLSPFHFQRLFRRETGESPAECLTRIRLDRAGHLLRVNADLPISRIAYDCGFSSPATFSRSFSQRYGCSPSHFRKEGLFLSNDQLPGDFPVEVVYFSETTIFYTHTSVFQSDFLRAFDSAKVFCQLEGIETGGMFGVYAQIPFHIPRQQLNYFAGIAIDQATDRLPADRLFTIPAGRYARFYSSVSYDDLIHELTRFQQHWLNKSPYHITRIFAFEHMLPFNHQQDDRPERYIYLPVERS